MGEPSSSLRDQTISRFERIKVELIKEGAVEYENGIGVDCGDLICSLFLANNCLCLLCLLAKSCTHSKVGTMSDFWGKLTGSVFVPSQG